ncbi:hypothetical protein [Prosthecobacter sp.]|uniref:hypothetical protein n=1 Tax=Prosthecobacter sp. TaxID=1965333 RepID=UPI0037842303
MVLARLEKEKLSAAERKKHIKQIEEDYREDLTEQLTERADILLNEKIRSTS